MQTDVAIPLLGVLVVEDNESLQETLCDTLSDEGFDPVACGTGAEALALAEQSTFAIAIVDQKLPDINGDALCARIRSDPDFEHVKILVISGVAEQDEVDRILACGADDFIKKPFEIDQVITRMAELVGLSE